MSIYLLGSLRDDIAFFRLFRLVDKSTWGFGFSTVFDFNHFRRLMLVIQFPMQSPMNADGIVVSRRCCSSMPFCCCPREAQKSASLATRIQQQLGCSSLTPQLSVHSTKSCRFDTLIWCTSRPSTASHSSLFTLLHHYTRLPPQVPSLELQEP